ncbi:MAG TPA: AAA family ATPase [Candidatus Binatia bacterium]|jgi:general secretion pathway protein A
MVPLYGEFFGLTRQPFSVSPDPSFLYRSPGHSEALAQLVYGITARRGFVVLTGEVGTGKTTLIHSLLQQLDDGHTHIAFVFTLIDNPKDLLRSVCEDLDLISFEDEKKEMHEYIATLNRFLLESYRKGDNVALVIDEAQNLSPEVLEGVRLLSNFETSQDKVLQILLVGQPELGTRLNAPELRQLKQRVALRYHLSPLNLPQCKEYIAQRLEIAGGSPAIFPAKTVETVQAYSGGIPRLINILCDNGMLTAYALGKKTVEPSMIEETCRDLNLSGPARRSVSPSPEPAAAAPRWSSKPKEIFSPPHAEEHSKPVNPWVATRPVASNANPAVSEPAPRREVARDDVFQPAAAPAQSGEAPRNELPGDREIKRPAVPPHPPETAAQNLRSSAAESRPETPPAGPFDRAITTLTKAEVAREEEPKKPDISSPPASSPQPSAAVQPANPQPKIFQPANPAQPANSPPPANSPQLANEPRNSISRAGPVGSQTVPQRFFDRMVVALTEAMGPMASFVVREQIDAMGESRTAFPKRRLSELVAVTSREILSETMEARFQSLMLEEIRAMNPGKENR